jgi:hypothetical protein
MRRTAGKKQVRGTTERTDIGLFQGISQGILEKVWSGDECFSFPLPRREATWGRGTATCPPKRVARRRKRWRGTWAPAHPNRPLRCGVYPRADLRPDAGNHATSSPRSETRTAKSSLVQGEKQGRSKKWAAPGAVGLVACICLEQSPPPAACARDARGPEFRTHSQISLVQGEKQGRNKKWAAPGPARSEAVKTYNKITSVGEFWKSWLPRTAPVSPALARARARR